MTEKLFVDDVYLRQFRAKVVRAIREGDRSRVVLDRTAFFPTGGGQPHDTGRLSGLPVLDVIEEGDDVIHVLQGEPPAGEVEGVIDWDRRFDLMQQHCGQHILSQAFIQVVKAETSSFHLGDEICSIELNRGVNDDHLARAEAIANAVILENREIAAVVHQRGASLDAAILRKLPPEVDRVRVVSIRDFDHSPCCGTHPRRTGEVGVVKTMGWEKVTGGTKVSFLCGGRVLREFERRNRIMASLATKLSALPERMGEAVDRIVEENKVVRKRLDLLDGELAGYVATDLAAKARVVGTTRLIVARFDDREMKDFVRLGTVIRDRCAGVVAMIGGGGRSPAMVLAAAKDVAIDLRPLHKEAMAILGGKGGGQPLFVQGGGGDPAKVDDAMKKTEDALVRLLGGAA